MAWLDDSRQWDEEAQKYFVVSPKSGLSPASSSSIPSLSLGESSNPSLCDSTIPNFGVSSESLGTSSSSIVSTTEYTSTGSWDGNVWYKKLNLLEQPRPVIEFNATFAGQTDHGKGKRPRWLDPNISSNSWKKSTKLNEENGEDRRSFVEEKNDRDDVNNVSGVEISYVSDSGSDPEHEVISESNIKYTSRNKASRRSMNLDFGTLDLALHLRSPDITVETLSTPELSGLRTSSWNRSPTRSFIRNFP